MREIKFKAWDKIRNEMVYDATEYNLRLLEYMRGDENWESRIGFFPEMDGQVFEVLEFTGLHDKNGKEICEGDIMTSVRNGERMVCEVMWIAESAAFSIWWYDEPEIIGNIFKNPELIP